MVAMPVYPCLFLIHLLQSTGDSLLSQPPHTVAEHHNDDEGYKEDQAKGDSDEG